ALFEQTDRLLLAAFGQLRGDPKVEADPGGRLRYWIEEYRDHQGLLCVVYRPDGTLLAKTTGLQDESLPAPQAPGGRLAFNGRFPSIGRQRVMAERLRLGRQEAVMMVLAPLEAVDQELDHVRSVLFAAGPVALLLSAGFGYWLARKALAPVDR